jgi:hypothetical protein
MGSGGSFCPTGEPTGTHFHFPSVSYIIRNFGKPIIAADTHLLKLQRLQNRALRTTGNFPRRTPVRELHNAFSIPYIYYYITELSRKQAEVI